MTNEERYIAELHAMQSGVAAKIELNPNDTSAKHLRVGVNSAMVGNSALARLLIAKGLFTLDEYYKELADVMQEERESYESFLSAHYGKEIKLH
jgi:biotin synthase-like enzyme